MRVATHNSEAQAYAARLLAVAHGDPITQTRSFCRWIESRVEWEMEGIIEALQGCEPVRGFNPGDSADLDAWAN
jgi:hypothetical protein